MTWPKCVCTTAISWGGPHLSGTPAQHLPAALTGPAGGNGKKRLRWWPGGPSPGHRKSKLKWKCQYRILSGPPASRGTGRPTGPCRPCRRCRTARTGSGSHRAWGTAQATMSSQGSMAKVWPRTMARTRGWQWLAVDDALAVSGLQLGEPVRRWPGRPPRWAKLCTPPRGLRPGDSRHCHGDGGGDQQAGGIATSGSQQAEQRRRRRTTGGKSWGSGCR